MPTSCSAYGCSNRCQNNADSRRFFSFPLTNKKLLEAWLQSIGRPNFVPTTSSKICSAHFLPRDFAAYGLRKRRLKPDASPSLFEYPKNKLGESYEKPPAPHDHDHDYDRSDKVVKDVGASRRTNTKDLGICLNLMVSQGENQMQEAVGTNIYDDVCLNTEEILSLSGDKVEVELVIVSCRDKSTQTRTPSNHHLADAMAPKINDLVQKIQRHDEEIRNLKKLLGFSASATRKNKRRGKMFSS